MASSPVLLQQSPNKIHRTKNEHNKKQPDPKPLKLIPAPHLSKKDIENKDPKEGSLRACVSRIPVMAKSLRLQTPSDFSQSHCRWEEKPLAVKANKRKPSARSVPFNRLEHRCTGMASKNQQSLSVLQSRSGTENNIYKVKPAKPRAVFPSNGNSAKDKGNASQADVLSILHQKASQRVACTSVMKNRQKDGATTETLKSVHFSPDTSALQSILQNEGVKAVAPVGATPQTSVCRAGRGTSVYSAQRVPVRKHCAEVAGGQAAGALKDTPSKTWSPQRVTSTKHQPQVVQKLFDDKEDKQNTNVTETDPQTQAEHQGNTSKDKGENVLSDHAVLLSILQNKAPSVTSLTSATPQSKPYDSLPQRVPVKKSQQNEGPTGSLKLVHFSPDIRALQSILQNEGVKAVGATPRSSACPAGRGTSVYSAQRVPVRKNRAEVTGEAAAGALKETPSKKWTPQRVPNTKHQPMSAMKWPLSRGASLYGTPGLGSCKSIIQPQQEDIVQRLFDDREDEQSTKVTDQDLGTQAEQLPVQASATDFCEQSKSTDGDEKEEEEEQKFVGGQMFQQAPHRESVIFFSTGKKLFRARRIEKQESSAQQDQQALFSSLHKNDENSSESELTTQKNPSVQPLPRDLVVQKTCSQISAVAMLRKRFPPLEELLLDEEVATYTSLSAPAPVSSLSAWPRCGNPLASILHLEESTRFVPISFEPLSGPSSHSKR
ncbi:uncharacterized protein troap isoform X2 [Parambassis ranga]|uniref:Uncharacterized protein troap isoform X2 n=1 Tax=Parambassis ranga TaxID=210632 RepID=A0A6P7IV31_9TELE|nr:uncharacterized protein LOC114438299 isoform X2 [Parambassis ranga]